MSRYHRAEIATTAIVRPVKPGRDALINSLSPFFVSALRKQPHSMPIRFGDHATDSATTLEPGMYDATISEATLVTENGQPKKTQDGKSQIDIYFRVGEENVKRRYSFSFGQNKANGQWAALAKMIEAATGVKCGDAAQRDVTDEDLVGKRIRIVVETNDRGYSDVANVMRSAQPAQRPKPQPVAADELSPDEIPF